LSHSANPGVYFYFIFISLSFLQFKCLPNTNGFLYHIHLIFTTALRVLSVS
jgi:hypothetical protein